MNKKSLIFISLILTAFLAFTSCSTTIRATIQRPAELDLNGADTISVLPVQISETGIFQNSGVIGDIFGFFSSIKYMNNDAYDVADYITRGLEQGIAASPYVDLVYSASVQSALKNSKTVPCDVYLSGTISHYKSEIKNTTKKITVNGEKVQELFYYREVSFDLTYQIIDSSTNTIIAVRTISVSNTSGDERDEDDVESTMNTIRYDLNDIINTIMKQIQPYTETKYISLLKDKSKDPDMKTADELAKKGLLDSSRELYLKLYETRYYFEAGYNAAIILEAQGKYEEAYEEMQALVMRFGDKQAITALNDIQREMNSRDALREQLSK